MQTALTVVGVGVGMLLGFVLFGGPMILADWFRKRQQQTIVRQVELTEALDERLGPLVAPVVRRPLFGPWEVRVAVPFHQPAAVAQLLSVVDEAFSGVEAGLHPYRIVLSAMPVSPRDRHASRMSRSVERWAGEPVAAA